jgi:hypothetical protein
MLKAKRPAPGAFRADIDPTANSIPIRFCTQRVGLGKRWNLSAASAIHAVWPKQAAMKIIEE